MDAAGPRTAWVLTDGKAGDLGQCLAVTEALGLEAEDRRLRPRPPFVWAMPWGPIDPREGPGRPHSPIAPPFPDLLVASGRRAVPYVRLVRRLAQGRTFTVFLKDPRTGAGTADLIWVPSHDWLRGDNVIATPTPPHRFSAARLAAARAAPRPEIAALPAPRVAVLVGGNGRHHRFTARDIERFAALVVQLAAEASVMATTSRRTPPALAAALAAALKGRPHLIWTGGGDNPILDFLANAAAVVVTTDSANMVGEATATGRPVLTFAPSGGHPRLDRFITGLKQSGIVRDFNGRLETYSYEPIDSTPVLAAAILERYRRAEHGPHHPISGRWANGD